MLKQLKSITIELHVWPCERKRKQEEQRWDRSGSLVEEGKGRRERGPNVNMMIVKAG